MANQPIFVAAYRQDFGTLVAARANEAQDLFTPGAAGCRDGSLWAWGHGGYGNLAQGDTNHSYKPVRCQKTGDTPLEEVVEFWPGHGYYNACFALTRDGTLWAMGDNSWGKLGVDDGTTDKHLFTEVVGLPSGAVIRKVAPCGSRAARRPRCS